MLYIIRTDYNVPTQPGILWNRIKKYRKSGVYVVNSANPILGTSSFHGYNSIAEPAYLNAWNLFWTEVLPPEDILAESNWWGSDNSENFKISPHVDYDPWLIVDPLPGIFPKPFIGEELLPKTLAITSAYPNPFNANVIFEFSMPNAGEARGAIYDLLGRKVKTIADRQFTAGTHTVVWDGKNESGRVVGSGIYFFRLESGDKLAVEKVTLLK